MRNVFLFGLLLTAVVATFLASPVSAQTDEWHKTYNVTGKARVYIQTNDGSVRVSTWSGKQVEARVETVGWRIDNSEVRIIESQTGDRLDIEARVPNTNWNGLRRHSLRIDVRIPVESDLVIRTGDGSVEADSNVGLTEIHTGDGHIRVSRVKGDIRLSTNDGHIEATGLDGRLDASSGDGHITVNGRFESLNLKTNDGAIDATVSKGSRMANNWDIRTGDGSVALRLPDDFKADLDVHTRDGRISSDLPIELIGRTSRGHFAGKLNGGGLALTTRTGDGSIRIEVDNGAT